MIITQGLLSNLIVTQGYTPLTPIPPQTGLDNRDATGVNTLNRNATGTPLNSRTITGRAPN